MQIYNYDAKTLEYLGVSEADEDPVDAGDFLIPAFASVIEPPVAGADEVAVFDSDNDEWNLVTDLRGTEYWLGDGSHGTVNDINIELPVDALLSAPPPSVSDVVAIKVVEISTVTRAAATGGFVSDALGTDHFYGTLETDQLNLSALVALDADRIYPCRDESDQSWDRRAHTIAQLRTVMTTGTDYIQTILIQKDVFVAQLLAIAADSLLTDDEKRTQINALVIQY